MSAAPEKHVQEDTLRVALVAGELRQGGAEKQLVYIARALDRAGVQVKVFSLTRGDYYEGRLAALGLPPVWFGIHANPLARIISLAHAGRGFRPHILQSAHYFTNFHVAIAARLIGISRPLSIGCIRSDPQRFRSRSLLRLPSALIANSSIAREHAIQAGVSPQKVHVLPNVIDLEEFDSAMLAVCGQAVCGQAVCGQPSAAGPQTAWPQTAWPKPASKYVIAITVSRLIPVKRLEVFLKALALARQEAPELRGVLAGEGSERGALEKLAADLGLLSAISFLGHQENIPALLSQADMLILTSEYEGFPNVLLEAMAACLPVITTPAGDAGLVVQDGITGFVVPHGDVKSLANRMVLLAKNTGKSAARQSPARQSAARLRRQLGEAGRRRVERTFSSIELAPRLLWLYQEIAQARGDRRLLDRLVTPLIQG